MTITVTVTLPVEGFLHVLYVIETAEGDPGFIAELRETAQDMRNQIAEHNIPDEVIREIVKNNLIKHQRDNN